MPEEDAEQGQALRKNGRLSLLLRAVSQPADKRSRSLSIVSSFDPPLTPGCHAVIGTELLNIHPILKVRPALAREGRHLAEFFARDFHGHSALRKIDSGGRPRHQHVLVLI